MLRPDMWMGDMIWLLPQMLVTPSKAYTLGVEPVWAEQAIVDSSKVVVKI